MAEPRQRPYRALRHRDFRLLGTATLISIIGTQMQNVGIDWHVYVLTHSPLALGAVGLVRVLPLIAFSMWGGVLADRHDRKRIQFTTQATMAVIAVWLAIATWTGRDSIWLVYLLTALTAATNAFDAPARQALGAQNRCPFGHLAGDQGFRSGPGAGRRRRRGSGCGG